MDPNKPAAPEERSTSSDKIANRLVALGSAAVLTVYAAGYMRTRSAAQRFDAAVRPRVVIPAAAPMAPGPVTAPAPSAEPATPATPRPAVTANPASHPPTSTAAPPRKPRRSSPAAKPPQTAAPALAPTETPPAPAIAPVAEVIITPVVEPPPAPTPPPQPQYTDGAYSGWGRSRRGDIEATVVIEGGRIVSAVISQCWTRWSCSIVQHLQGQVVARRSQEVDYVSGATQSANAFYYAVVEALSKAKCAECVLPPLQ